MGNWRYLFADLRTNTLLAELPMSQVSFNSPLNGSGAFSGVCPLTGADALKKLDPLSALLEDRTSLYVESDGVLVWGGIVWLTDYTSDGSGIQVNANEFWSYFDQRAIYDTLVYSGIDQLAIVRDILSYAQNRIGPVGNYVGFSFGGDIGINLGLETSGVLRDRTYNWYEAKGVKAAIEELSQVNNGFDFGVSVDWINNVPTKTFHLYYPRRGLAATASGLVWEFPGNVIKVRFPKDGKSMATHIMSFGAGNADNRLKAEVVDTSLIDAGYPLLDKTTTHGDVTIQNTLNDWSTAELKAYNSPVFLPELTVKMDRFPIFGQFQQGDEFRFIYNGPYSYKQPIDTYFRIIDIKTQPQEKGKPGIATLILGPTFS
jgi:hypothetical protein